MGYTYGTKGAAPLGGLPKKSSSSGKDYSAVFFIGTSGTFIVPSGYSKVRLTAVGAGADGAYGNAGSGGIGGGGGGFSQSDIVSVAANAVVTYFAGTSRVATPSSASVGSVSISATRGNGATPGQGSGGLINTTGGAGSSTGSGGGGGAGGPDGNGGAGGAGNTGAHTVGTTGSTLAGGGGGGGYIVSGLGAYCGGGGGGLGMHGWNAAATKPGYFANNNSAWLAPSTPGLSQNNTPVIGYGGSGGVGGGGGGGGGSYNDGAGTTFACSSGIGGHGMVIIEMWP